MMSIIVRSAVFALATVVSSALFAQTYPSKPIHVIIGAGAGGATDVVARLVSDEAGKRLGQPMIVENRVGAGGLIAAQAVRSSAPDGYTLFGGSGTPFTSVFLKTNNMDISKDLQPVSLMSLGDQFVFVRSDLGVTNMEQLAAKAKTTRLKHASVFTTQEILVAILAKQAGGMEYDNIPFKANDQALSCMANGDCDFYINSSPASAAFIQSGRVRVIATLAAGRSPLQPNVPTLKEQGYNFDFRFNLGLWTVLGTPADAVAKLGAAVAAAVKVPTVAERILALGIVATASTPEELVRAHQAEVRMWTEGAALTKYQPQ